MKTIILLDTETTGLDATRDTCIEVAVASYDVKQACVGECFASLIYAEANAAQAINRIPVEALREAPPAGAVWGIVRGIISHSASPIAFVAHNAEFDKGFTPPDVAGMVPWICSRLDVEWPLSKPGASLVEVALAHGVPVHDNHRALTDVLLLAKTFQAAHRICDVQAMLAKAMRPKVEVVSLAPFEEKEIVKQHGFQWDPARREWRRRIVQDEIAALPFKVRRAS